MRRREFITLLGGAAAWPLAARAQQGERVRRIAILIGIPEGDPQAALRMAAIQRGLQRRGWTDNIRFETRFSAGDRDRLRAYARELLGPKPDVIFVGNTSALAAVHGETQTVPIVFAQVDDPVAHGFVSSLARPGANITGFTNFEESIPGKWLGVLKELAPNISRVGFMYDIGNPAGHSSLETIKAVASSLGVEVLAAAVHDAAGIESSIGSIADGGGAALIVRGGSTTVAHRDHIITLAARHRLPTMYPYRYFVASGGLMSYGVDTIDLYERAASYIDRILKGENAADLPVQQPTKFEFVVNLKTAKALGIEVPPSLLARADEVIE